jgi:hypothetical protein
MRHTSGPKDGAERVLGCRSVDLKDYPEGSAVLSGVCIDKNSALSSEGLKKKRVPGAHAKAFGWI